jgi:hypothetical protein
MMLKNQQATASARRLTLEEVTRRKAAVAVLF